MPILLATPSGVEPPAPLAFWFHGYGADKEVHRPELARLAEAGFLAVAMDAVGHGGRLLPEIRDRIRDAPREEALPLMADLAARTAADVGPVIDALAADHGADPRRVAAVGVSMGAYGVYRALVVEPRIRAAVSVLGSPEWPHPLSPHAEIDAFARVALLSIVAERDENVPPAPARRLHRTLQSRHPAARQRFVEIPGAEHLMNERQWNAAMDETLGWLRLHAR